MGGETNLATLLESMQPVLKAGEYVFVSFENSAYGTQALLNPIAMFIEDEGMTLVIPVEKAIEANIPHDTIFRCITLSVHSSLDAVGLTAVFSSKLAEHGISANVIAGYYHDHIFVHTQHVDKALAALQELAQ